MKQITVEHKPSPMKLEVMRVESWPIWEKEISEFPWTYEDNETCYIIQGEAVISTESGDSVTISEGDLVNFPRQLNCTWKITKAMRKYYKLG